MAGAGPAGRKRSSWSRRAGLPSVATATASTGARGGSRSSASRSRRSQTRASVVGAASRTPQRVAAGIRQLEFEFEFGAGQVAQGESREEAREQAADHEEQRLEPIERGFGGDGFLEAQRVRGGDRRFAPCAAQHGESGGEAGAEARRDDGGRQREERSQAVDAEARERLGERVARREQVDGQRREERRLVARRHDAGCAGGALRREAARGEQRERPRRRDAGDGGKSLRARPLDQRARERGVAREQMAESGSVELYGGFAGARTAARGDRLGARRCGERDVEERVARGALERGMRDAHHERAAHRARVGERRARMDAGARCGGRHREHRRARSRLGDDRERRFGEWRVRADLRRGGQRRHE